MARTTPHDRPLTEAQPLYWRIATRLLDELSDGTVPPGERLPSERQLALHYRVSRETVRQALEVLRHRGLVATDRRGSHATLSGPPVETPSTLTFPVGARTAGPGAVDRATVAWETPRRSTPPPWGWPRTGRPWCTTTSPRAPTVVAGVRQ